MIYPIVVYGDPVLKKQAEDIEQGSLDVKALAADMFETMYAASGVGLAAPQIGKSIRMFVVDGEPMDEELKDFKKVFINPEILEESGEDWAFEEGCLSIPGIRADVYRPEQIRIRYYDADWQEHTEDYDGIAARIIQHEYDHIEGVLFTDYLSGLKKRLLQTKLQNISKGQVRTDYRIQAPLRK
ncbi:peptide deformylase [Cesiribacter andamanensis]|uniref:Peptide deformylase n=1 Tax=Cesiribacter andamanensis AMV16 TaxID=1279009 RepID=M7NAH8_9BACT|nr:peptide deformylase [Cesiribacter andamanensis]EMR04206.1 Peptide deformylase [Cesiribacter andamanensis AMV16]